MQDIRRERVLPALAACLCGLILLGGCSEPQHRKANKNVLEAVAKAQRLYDQALSLMAGTPFKVHGEFAPLVQLRSFEGKDVQPVVDEPMNPKALAAIQQAEQELEQALAANEAAEPTEKSRASAMLGRISALKGQYHDAVAAAARSKAGKALSGVSEAFASAQAEERLKVYFDQLLQITGQEVEERFSAAQGEHAKIQGQIDVLKAELAGLQDKIRRLNGVNSGLIAEARNLRLESRTAGGEESLRLFDQAMEKQKQANKNQYEIINAEDRTVFVEGQVKLLALEAAEAQERAKAAEDVLTDRRKRLKSDQQDSGQIAGLLTEIRSRLSDHLQQAADAVAQAKRAEDEAVKAYQLASNRFDRARRARMPERDLDGILQQAGSLMAEGHVYTRSLALQSRIERVLGMLPQLAVKPTDAEPALVEQLKGYAPAPDKLQQEAQARFKQAAELFTDALNLARREPNRWIYEEGVAAANSALERLSGGGQ